MNKINVPIMLDMDQRLKDEILKVNQYDTNIWELSLTLIKNGVAVVVTDLSARMWCSKPDGTHVYKDCVISGGKIIADAGGQMFTAAGTVDCEIELSGATQTLGSPQFCIGVAKSVKDEHAMESSDEYTAINAAVTAAEQSATQAGQSATQAGQSATEAGQAATRAGQSSSDALASQNAAAISATNAAASETTAKQQAEIAAQKEEAAAISKSDAEGAAIRAKASEDAAAEYAAQAAGSSTITFWIDPADNGLNITVNDETTA
ncbi:hypothetical protein SAMN04515656_1024 [Eubacterium aggregans]|uniref:BppU N-terminal domain-containing protein n=1 Tax=Eubacterium aggregans TaxID=81409 RepID=A0A1H3XCM1_9FIRM|nr:BppU family phage baseplate upper protein [Eubacterium aggregans]SDZ97083.1 hypothetical protein SAMN04515656_1024 [Eubacterium aggregans]